jgi:hypothetical protein
MMRRRIPGPLLAPRTAAASPRSRTPPTRPQMVRRRIPGPSLAPRTPVPSPRPRTPPTRPQMVRRQIPSPRPRAPITLDWTRTKFPRRTLRF